MEASTSCAISVHDELVAPDISAFIIIDGGVLIHSLLGTAVQCKTFDAYFDKVFCPRVRYDLNRSIRVDSSSAAVLHKKNVSIELCLMFKVLHSRLNCCFLLHFLVMEQQ